MGYVIETIYFLTAVLFIIGLKRMSHPTTARSGIVWAGYGMVLATVVMKMTVTVSLGKLLRRWFRWIKHFIWWIVETLRKYCQFERLLLDLIFVKCLF